MVLKTIYELFDTSLTNLHIAKESDMSEESIRRFRKGIVPLEHAKYINVEKIYQFAIRYYPRYVLEEHQDLYESHYHQDIINRSEWSLDYIKQFQSKNVLYEYMLNHELVADDYQSSPTTDQKRYVVIVKSQNDWLIYVYKRL